MIRERASEFIVCLVMFLSIFVYLINNYFYQIAFKDNILLVLNFLTVNCSYGSFLKMYR